MTTLVILLVSIFMDYTVMAKSKYYLVETEEQDVDTKDIVLDDDQVTNDYENQEVPVGAGKVAKEGKLIFRPGHSKKIFKIFLLLKQFLEKNNQN